MEETAKRIIEKLEKHLSELREIAASSRPPDETKLERLRERISRLISGFSEEEAERLAKCKSSYDVWNDPRQSYQDWFKDEVAELEKFIIGLQEEIKNHPEDVIMRASDKVSHLKKTDSVFLIHGHDEKNLGELKKYLEETLKLKAIVLGSQPNFSRALIEKLEAEGDSATYAICLMTGDDKVLKNGEEYFQARPNVIFELGWFFAKLGRKHVCILENENQKKHSDVSGITTYRFKSDVRDVFPKLLIELSAAKLIRS